MAETCRVCSADITKRMVETATACEYKGGSSTHAAVGTSMHPLRLPSVSESGLMSSGLRNIPCMRSDSIATTFAAILHSVKNLGSFVHLVRQGDIDPRDLIEVSNAVLGERVCLVAEIREGENGTSPLHRLHTNVLGEAAEMTEEKMLRVFLQTQAASSSAVFYWSESVLSYSVVLNQLPSTVWAVYSKGSARRDDGHVKMQTLQINSKSKVRVLPFFYPLPQTNPMMVMGQGGADRVSWNDLEVDMAALCDPVVQRVYCSRMPSARCYCCQYLVNLHREVHADDGCPAERLSRLRLSKKFWQNVSSGKGRGPRGIPQGAVQPGV